MQVKRCSPRAQLKFRPSQLPFAHFLIAQYRRLAAERARIHGGRGRRPAAGRFTASAWQKAVKQAAQRWQQEFSGLVAVAARPGSRGEITNVVSGGVLSARSRATSIG